MVGLRAPAVGQNPQARAFYETETLRCGWSVRQLDRQVNNQFYERIALSHNKAAMLGKAEVAEPATPSRPSRPSRTPLYWVPQPQDEYSESDLEDALIQHLADFLLELGDDFAFIGRQRRLRLDDSWFRIDLLFFHRSLKCLLVIDLKVGQFSYADAGQMHVFELRPPALDEARRKPAHRADPVRRQRQQRSALRSKVCPTRC